MRSCVECIGDYPEPTWFDSPPPSYPPQMSEEQIISLEQQEEKIDATVNTPSNT